mgnify:FL=1
MVTTIQISESLQNELSQKRMFDRETYEEVIWDLIEDSMELNKQTREEIARSRAEIKAGKFYKLSEVKEEVGLDV